MNKLVVASSNPGKIREFEQMLKPLGFEIVAQSQLGVMDTEEPHATFVENALAKARHASRLSRMPALADDSGICVAALGGEPGVHSARYACDTPMGIAEVRDTRDKRNNEKLVASLSTQRDRRAHYYCVIVLMRHGEDPEPLIAEGRWQGEMITEPRGTGGFGYDPYFYLPALGQTAAQLQADQKNALSHRGHALRHLAARLLAERR